MTTSTTRLTRISASLFSAMVLLLVAPGNVILRNLGDVGYSGRLVGAFMAAFVVVGAASAWLTGRSSGLGGDTEAEGSGGTAGDTRDGAEPAHGADAVAIGTVDHNARASRGGLARLILLPGVLALAIDAAATWSQQPDISMGAAIGIDAAAIVAAFVAIWAPPLPVLLTVVAVIVPVTLAQTVAQHAVAWSSEGSAAASRRADDGAGAAIAGKGNVYHIILDAFQREVFAKLRDDDASVAPAGFTYFPRFTSGYAFTMYSLPNLLLGRPYRASETFDAWQDAARNEGLWRALADGGVPMSLYPHWQTYCSPLATSCFSTQQAMRELAGATPEAVLVDLWFLGFAPGSLRKALIEEMRTREIVAAGAADLAAAKGSTDVQPTPARAHTWGAEGDHHPLTRVFSISAAVGALTGGEGGSTRSFAVNEKLASLANVDRFLSEERSRAATGRYVFLHVNVPHLPFVLDAGCNLKDETSHIAGTRRDGTLVPAIMDQSSCALRILKRIVDGLGDMGRLDNSLVVAHSDHGHDPDHGQRLLARFPFYFTNEWEGGDDRGSLRSSLAVGLRSHALLLLKMPRGADIAGAAESRAQMIDIAPTILAHFGLPTTEFDGMALQSVPLPDAREVTFFAGEPSPEFFRGGTARNVVFPAGERFSRFVLDGGVWRYRDDVPVH